VSKLLWLDDLRNPFNVDWVSRYVPGFEGDVIWVKSYLEFVENIQKNGLPDRISFDHDLGDEHIKFYFDNGGHENPPNPEKVSFIEKTGYDCAKWLINYCIENDLKLPEFTVHSANPVGSQNIKRILNNFNNK
jgi:hypothetical protein